MVRPLGVGAGSDSAAVSDVVVVVPVHNEQELLPACLRSLHAAAARVEIPVRIVVVLDACTDASAAACDPGVHVVRTGRRNVGAARAAGFAAAGPGAGTWCVSTDADTEVAPDWLAVHLRHAATGVDVVAGTVRVRDWGPHPVGLAAHFEAGYSQADGHRHVHGANLGVRGRAYAELGGFAALAAHEDVDLVDRALERGLAVRWCSDAVVHTSSRTDGRAPDGFAAHLAALSLDAASVS